MERALKKKKKGFGLEVFVKISSTSHPYHLLPTHVTHALCKGGRGKDEEMGLEKERIESPGIQYLVH